MSIRPEVLLGKTVRYVAALRGGGSALPGLFVEKIDSNFISRTLATLPHGVVVISGTNGKTTTTKMVVELLESQGMKVFTNRTGSNFTRGVAAALLGEVDMHGQLDKDIAVLELDEAHAVHFVRAVKPSYSLLLNVMRDQLDRFGEIDTTARLLQLTAKATTNTVVLNREDPRLQAIGKKLSTKTIYYGLSESLKSQFPDDDSMRRSLTQPSQKNETEVSVELTELKDHVAILHIDNKKIDIELNLDGVYNVYNGVAALTLVRTILGNKRDDAKLYHALKAVKPAFGRGERFNVKGQPLELVLVKNPAGFRLSLASFLPTGYATMIAINDEYADGRDMSWLWDVEFESLTKIGVSMVSGVRAYDMALRLQYEEVDCTDVDTDISSALDSFINANLASPKRIYCTYTAMLKIRKYLRRYTDVETIS